MRALAFRIAIPFLLTALALDAKWQDRLYPFAELTDEMRAGIDLKDGSVEDWLEVLGEPTLTPLDFATPPSYPDYDPSSFDFRIWLAWHDASDRLFVAAEIVDDIYVHVDEFFDRHRFPPAEATVHFLVDGDRSGGAVDGVDGIVQAQGYWAVAKNYRNDSNLTLNYNLGGEVPWVTQIPYADGGGSIVDSRPRFYVVEFYLTPFDRLTLEDPEQSLVSDLFADKTIGFKVSMVDKDEDPGPGKFMPDRVHSLLGPDASRENLGPTSDLWAHGILVDAEGRTDDTAVESVTWARIKASLFE